MINARSLFENLPPDIYEKMISYVRENPQTLLEIGGIRRWLSSVRFESNKNNMKKPDAPDENSYDYTVDWNVYSLNNQVSNDRPAHLIKPVTAIPRISKNIKEKKLLSIGPRSEHELFILYGHGFSPENVTAIDLMSYSPLIQIGDMHSLPFPDNSFDVLVCGWTLAYSTDKKRAASEMARCVRPGGVIAMGNSNFELPTVASVLDLFGSNVGQVFFQHDRSDCENPDDETGLVMTVFEIVKNA